MIRFDAIVVGAGPAGSVCAATLARKGRHVLLVDRAKFPRDKVCGDCLNPSVWPVLERLELHERILALPHAKIDTIAYEAIGGIRVRFRVPDDPFPEMTIKRRDFDASLVARAVELGVDFRDGVSVLRVSEGWKIETDAGTFSAPVLVAADGRNSFIARATNRIGPAPRDRVALQCHGPRPNDHGSEVRMFFRKDGYGGTALLNEREINLCLVTTPERVESVRTAAMRDFSLPDHVEWRTIAPLSREDASDVARDGLFLVGDSARVVEPFTGEGIYYALRSGELAALAVVENDEAGYRRLHSEMYRGRLWINRLTRLAVTHPRITSAAIAGSRVLPLPLHWLTHRVLRVSQT